MEELKSLVDLLDLQEVDLQIDRSAPTGGDQIFRRYRKHGVGRAGRCPDDFKLKQIFVYVNGNGGRVAKGRHAATFCAEGCIVNPGLFRVPES